MSDDVKMSFEELGKVLIRKLKMIKNDDDFVLAVCCGLETEEQVQKLIAYIDSGNHTDEEIAVASVYIERGLA